MSCLITIFYFKQKYLKNHLWDRASKISIPKSKTWISIPYSQKVQKKHNHTETEYMAAKLTAEEVWGELYYLWKFSVKFELCQHQFTTLYLVYQMIRVSDDVIKSTFYFCEFCFYTEDPFWDFCLYLINF